MEEEHTHDVQVAVNIRPLLPGERARGCKNTITVAPGKKTRVRAGPRSFAFDRVYGGDDGSPSSKMFEDCVAPLVDGLLQGQNGTVLACGPSGSGKTYTLGMGRKAGDRVGLIHRTGKLLFDELETAKAKHQADFKLHVSFFEILREQTRDLLDCSNVVGPSTATASRGAMLVRISTLSEMVDYLERGSTSRASTSTKMHRESRRSHTIFTITLEQKLHSVSPADETSDMDMRDAHFCSKLHFVDFAGYGKRSTTTYDGICLRRGIYISKGLLDRVIGNIINTSGDEKKKKKALHVPHQVSSLTRVLQDSLGGNSKTVIIACVSPADIANEETLNTLQYVNSNIQNKFVANEDLISGEMHQMHQQLKYLQAQLSATDERALFNETLQRKITWLEAMNKEFSEELDEYHCQRSTIELCEIDGRERHSPVPHMGKLESNLHSMESFEYQNSETLSDETSLETDDPGQEWEQALMLKCQHREMIEQNKLLEENKGLHKNIEEAAAATKRLKEFLEAQNSSLHENSDTICFVDRRLWNQKRTVEEAEHALQHTFDASVEVRCLLREKDKEIENIKSQLHKLVYLLRTSEVQTKKLVIEQKMREQPDFMSSAVTVPGSQSESSNHYTNEISSLSTPTAFLLPMQWKFTPSGPAPFLEDAREVAKTPPMPMETVVTVGRSGKLTKSKMRDQRWRWPKPWKVSEWIKHNGETIPASRIKPRGSN